MLLDLPADKAKVLYNASTDIPEEAVCISCHYRLRGLTQFRCPECGRTFHPADSSTYTFIQTEGSHYATRAKKLIVIAALYVACLATLGPSLRLSQWFVAPENNQGAAEAMSWLAGRWDLDGRGGDTALYNGKAYNVFPPLWTLICFVYYALHSAVVGPPVVMFTMVYVLVVAAPIPILFYLAMRRSGLDLWWAALLAFYAIAGTCLRTEATVCQRGWIYSIQHVLSQAGIAIVLIDLLGRRRFWLAGIGVLMAAWSRQPCIAYALPVLWLALRSSQPKKLLLKAGIPILVAVAVPMALNWIKFGSPLETGYKYIFVGLGDSPPAFVLDGKGEIAIFGAHYIPGHAYDFFLSPPHVDVKHDGVEISTYRTGSAFWYGSPLLLLALWDVRRWWKDETRRVLMLATLPVIAAILAYHGPGYSSGGYYRYSMDFALVWLAVVAPWTTLRRGGPLPGGVGEDSNSPKSDRDAWRPWATIACTVWSVFYFYLVTPYFGL